MSIRAFQGRLAGRGVGGSSYPQIHRYLSEESPAEPSLGFLLAASELLEVRAEWLTLGSGLMTKEEEAHAEEARRVQRRVLAGTDLDLWEQAVEAMPELGELSMAAQAAFADAWQRYARFEVAQRGESARIWTESEEFRRRLASTLADHLMIPFQALGVHPVVSSEEFTDYTIAMLQALQAAWRVPLEPADVDVAQEERSYAEPAD